MSRKHQRRLRELADDERPDRTPRYIAGEDDVGPILSKAAFFLMSLVAFIAVVAGGIFFGTHQIERSLETNTLRYLQGTGYDQVGVDVDGRTITLTGMVPNQSAIAALPISVSELEGVGTVDSELAITTPEVTVGPVDSDPLHLTWDRNGVVVSGTVSTERIRDFVVTELADRFPGVDSEDLILREGVGDETEWVGDVIAVADGLSQVAGEGTIVVNPDEDLITVAAQLPDRQVRADVRRTTEDVLAGGVLRLVSGLTVEDAPPPPAPEVVEEVQVRLDDLIEGKVVEFELNSDALTRVGTRLLDDVYEALDQVPGVAVEIGGHADAQGDDATNLDLSERRAQSVKDYLVDRGINPDRLVVIGYGETRPIADNSTADGRARNRRIEFTALDD